ncbi:MAG: ABC transporter substrate-binding protein [Candidatus Bathyarchaeia archaeon]
MRRPVLALLMIVIAVAAFSAGWFLKPTPVARMEDVTFALNWLFDGEHPFYFAALDKGYYRENGINVKIVRGFGSFDTVKRVETKEATFGLADPGSVVVGRAQGFKVKIIAMPFDLPPFGVHTLKESGIDHPSKLVGKTIGAPAGDTQRILFPVLAKAVGIDPNSVTWVTMEAGSKIPSLAQKKVDATVYFFDTYETIYRACGGKEMVNIMPWYKYGVDMYGMALITHEDTIKNNPSLVKRFVDATLRGLQYGIMHPEESVKIMLDYQPQLDKDLVLSQMKVDISLMLTDRFREHGIGWIEKDRMQKTVDAVVSAYEIPPIPVEDVYTTEFLTRYELPEVTYEIPEF